MHPCARCATMKRTCCEEAEVVVTRGDVARVRRHARRSDFWERRLANPYDAEPDPDDPEWTRGSVAPDGTRRVLRRRASGACTFLGAAGCTLPEHVRPSICRLYPFTYTERGLTGEENPYWCPLPVVAAPGQNMSAVLGMERVTAEAVIERLYSELRRETHTDARRADLRPAL